MTVTVGVAKGETFFNPDVTGTYDSDEVSKLSIEGLVRERFDRKNTASFVIGWPKTNALELVFLTEEQAGDAVRRRKSEEVDNIWKILPDYLPAGCELVAFGILQFMHAKDVEADSVTDAMSDAESAADAWERG